MGKPRHIVNCMWQKGEWVVVIGGVFSRSEIVKEPTFTIASILEIGLEDLLVQPKNKHSRPKFVSKKTCQKIPVNEVKVYEKTRKPQVGDLVYYYKKDWNSNEESAVSHVVELRRSYGNDIDALIDMKEVQVWVSVDNLLVLDLNNTQK